MTAQLIDPDPVLGPILGPMLDPIPGHMQTVRACAAAVREALDALPKGPLAADGDPVDSLIGDVVEQERRLAELRLRLMQVAAEQREADKVAASGTDAWLSALTGSSRVAMAGGLWLARLLDERYPLVRTAFARGDLAEEQVRVIVRAAEQIPDGVCDADRDRAVAGLVERAVRERLDPARLRRVARRMLDTVSPPAADAHQKKLLEDEERRARAETWMTLHDNGDGTWAGRFVIPDLHAHLLRTVLEHLSSPRRLSRRTAQNGQGDQSCEGGQGGQEGEGGVSVVDESVPCDLNWSERLGQAFTELVEHLPSDGLANHGRVGATVMVHLDRQHLLDGLAAARLDSGTEISAGEARRLACNAGIIPAVLGGSPVPLDVGRESRLHTKAQRAALSATYDTCAAEGCRRPFAWTEVHHRLPWSQGGRTDLDNAIPVCGWHHQRAHDPDYAHTILPTGEIRYRRATTAARSASPERRDEPSRRSRGGAGRRSETDVRVSGFLPRLGA